MNERRQFGPKISITHFQGFLMTLKRHTISRVLNLEDVLHFLVKKKNNEEHHLIFVVFSQK